MNVEKIEQIISYCTYPDYSFEVQTDGRGEIYLFAHYMEPDTVTGVREIQRTRRWFLSPYMTESEIVRTAFKCIITSREHRVREHFKFSGQPVFSPHFDVMALLELCQKGRFEKRPKE